MKSNRKLTWGRAPIVQWRHLYTCSVPNCKCKILRQTPDGVFCEAHYFSLPSCSVDGCDAVAVPDPVFNKDGLCRYHLLGEAPIYPDSIAMEWSMIALCEENA